MIMALWAIKDIFWIFIHYIFSTMIKLTVYPVILKLHPHILVSRTWVILMMNMNYMRCIEGFASLASCLPSNSLVVLLCFGNKASSIYKCNVIFVPIF